MNKAAILLLGHRPHDLVGAHNCSYHRRTPAAVLEKMLLAQEHTAASQMETRDIDKADRNRYTTSNRHPRTWDTKTYSASCVDFSATPNCTHANVPIFIHLPTGEHACTEIDTGLRSASLALNSSHSTVHKPLSLSWVTGFKLCKHHRIRTIPHRNLPHRQEDDLMTKTTQQRHI